MKRASDAVPPRRIKWHKISLFGVSLALFVLALELMKAGARGLAPLIQNALDVSNPINGLGFGWLSACLVMSGSPVAAAALTFLDAGVVDPVSAFAMITGSRLGASLIVLFIGLLYVLRGHERITSLTTGLLALTVTAAVYLPALPLGYLMVSLGLLKGHNNPRPAGPFVSALDMALGPPVGLASRLLPDWGVFLVGLGVIVASFNLFDKALPNLSLRESAFSEITRLLYRPIVTFALGLAVTFMTMSVSVSLGLLVPLSVRGYIRRENLVPYIMGCNISTFVDTLIAGLLLRNSDATAVVLAQMLSVLIISAIILTLSFPLFERSVLALVLWLVEGTGRLSVFLLVIVLIPVGLLLIR